jgi:hypothetical protein
VVCSSQGKEFAPFGEGITPEKSRKNPSFTKNIISTEKGGKQILIQK